MKLPRLLPFLLLFSAGVAAGQERGLWLDVPFVQQEEEGCGAAAISMLLQYWNAKGMAVDPTRMDVLAIQRLLYSKAAHGIYASSLENYVRDSGFTVFAVQGTWEDLEKHLKEGRPLILGIGPNHRKGPLHYLVAVGMDFKNPAVLVNDPARGKLIRIEREAFAKQWQATSNWMLLAVPQQAK